jgi:hypothetical protein
MRPTEQASSRLVACLNQRGLGGYLRVGQTTPWANIDKAFGLANVDDMSLEAIRAFLDLEEGGEQRVECYNDSLLTKYFGEFSLTGMSFRIAGGASAAFKEYASFYVQWMLP